MCETKTKVCSKCGEEKPLTNEYFNSRKDSKDGFRNDCKVCRYISTKEYKEIYNKEYWNNNKEKLSESNKEYHFQNRDILLKKMKQRRLNDIESYKERDQKYYEENKESILQKRKEYVEKNKEHVYLSNHKSYHTHIEKRRKYRSEYLKKRQSNDSLFDLRVKVSGLIRKSIKNKGYSKTTKTYDILGCSYEIFKQHIENQFQEGMTWDNHGEWHYDHIIPVASAQTEEELIKLNHYTNLQPLWAEDNLKKSDKISEEWGNIENTNY